MSPSAPKPFSCYRDRRYLGQTVALAIVAIALAIVAKQFDRGSVGRIALMGIESACFGYIIVITALSIRRLDELSQRIHLEAMAVSFTVTAVLVTTLGLLTKAGLPLGDWYLFAWPFMAVLWSLAVFVISRRYS